MYEGVHFEMGDQKKFRETDGEHIHFISSYVLLAIEIYQSFVLCRWSRAS